jgi:hypothetical protein
LKNNRTDRILIALALIILLLAGSGFYFDDWMWGMRRDRGAPIGVVSARMGDVRVKFEGDLKWQKASVGQDLIYNDAIYAGGNSEADLAVGDSKLKVAENTLVVLRRQQDVNFLKLNYGTLFGRVAQNEKIVIDTGDGKQIEFKPTAATNVVLRKIGAKMHLDVTAGQAEVKVDGKVSKLSRAASLTIDGARIETEKHRLIAMRPLRDQVFYAEGQTQIDFTWGYDDARPAKPDESYTLEFSAQPSFNKIHTTKTVRGQLSTSLTASRSLSLYYRVRGPGDQLSQIERINFVGLSPPLIVRPQAGEVFQVPAGSLAEISVEFRKDPKATVWYQIAADSEFRNIVANQNVPDSHSGRELAIGEYFLRARADYGEGRLTAWTETRSFRIEPRLEELRLTDRGLPDKVVIPNRRYPSKLYGADGTMAMEHLAAIGFLGRFFPLSKDSFDEVHILFEDEGSIHSEVDGSWPKDRLRPGRHRYRYRVAKAGYRPSVWSAPKTLDISLDPPRPLGDLHLGEASNSGFNVAWRFTPLLFAKTYDVEVADNPGFVRARELSVAEASVSLVLPSGQYYWRARARDGRGRIIGSFSPAYALKPIPSSVPQMLAKEDPVERNPAEEEPIPVARSEIKSNSENQPWNRSGWWAWLGTGYNFVDYRQAVPGRLSLNYQNVRGPSQYFEGGMTGDRGYGGVFTYKSIPGEVRIDNAEIDQNRYNWTMLSLEGLIKRASVVRLFNRQIVYGLRAGVQMHRTPFIFVDAFGEPKLKQNDMSTASMGALAEWSTNRWTYHWLMRYQFPFSAKSDGAESYRVSPVFAFDGSIGTSYSLSQQVKLGFFWYGQWHQYSFVYGDGEVTNSGSQSLFFSNLDLRLGIDF